MIPPKPGDHAVTSATNTRLQMIACNLLILLGERIGSSTRFCNRHCCVGRRRPVIRRRLAEPCIAPEGISQLEGRPLNRRLTAIVLFVAAQAACPTSAFADDFAMIIPMKGGGTYYVTARFGDTTSGELMVDTGSGYTTINEQTLASLKEDTRST